MRFHNFIVFFSENQIIPYLCFSTGMTLGFDHVRYTSKYSALKVLPFIFGLTNQVNQGKICNT